MLYELHKNNDYLVDIKTLSDKHLVLVFPQDLLYLRGLPRVYSYKLVIADDEIDDEVIYQEDNEEPIYYKCSREIFRLLLITDISIKLAEHNIHPTLCIGHDKDDEEVILDEMGEYIEYMIPSDNLEIESQLAAFFFHEIGNPQELEGMCDFLYHIIHFSGLGKFKQVEETPNEQTS